MGVREYFDFLFKNRFKQQKKDDSSMMDLALKVARETIGLDLVPVAPHPIEELPDPPEPEHPANEHWELVDYGRHKEWEKRDFDDENEEWDTPRTEFNPYKPEDKALLDEEDIKNLDEYFNFDNKSGKEHHVYKYKGLHGEDLQQEWDQDKYYKQGHWRTWLRGRHLHMSSPLSSWGALCGRHYVYDLDTKEIICIAMS